MKRLGKFSGKIYKDDEIKDMEECSVMIADDESEGSLTFLRSRNKIDCLLCRGCPMKTRAEMRKYDD